MFTFKRILQGIVLLQRCYTCNWEQRFLFLYVCGRKIRWHLLIAIRMSIINYHNWLSFIRIKIV